MNKTERQLLAMQRQARKNPKYRPGVKKKVKQITQAVAWNKFLSK